MRPVTRDSVRAALLKRINGQRSSDETLFDQIAACKEFVQASDALARAIREQEQQEDSGELILAAPGWLLPP